MVNPFRDTPVQKDLIRYPVTLKRLPEEFLEGRALDVGVWNPFTPLLQQRYPDLEILSTDSKMDFDVDKFHWSGSEFDVIFHFEVIEHLMNPLFHLQECARVLKPNGKMFLTTPRTWHPPFLWNPAHFLGFDRYRLRILLARAGFKVVRMEPLRTWNIFSYLRIGFFRPLLRWLYGSIVGRWWFIEVRKAD